MRHAYMASVGQYLTTDTVISSSLSAVTSIDRKGIKFGTQDWKKVGGSNHSRVTGHSWLGELLSLTVDWAQMAGKSMLNFLVITEIVWHCVPRFYDCNECRTSPFSAQLCWNLSSNQCEAMRKLDTRDKRVQAAGSPHFLKSMLRWETTK